GGGLVPRLVELSTTGTTFSHAIAYDDDGSLRAWFDCAGGDNRFVSLDSELRTFADFRWHHAVLTYDGATASLYVDAELIDKESTTACTDLDDVTYLSLGNLYGQLGYGYLGGLDEVAVLNVAVDEATVLAHYQRGLALDLKGG